MKTNVYTVTFNGVTTTRKTKHTYGYAAYNPNRRVGRSKVTFHHAYHAAAKSAGVDGLVTRIAPTDTYDTCVVCDGHGSYEVGPGAATPGMITVKCHNCGGTGRSPYKRLV